MKKLKAQTIDLILESSSALFICGAIFIVAYLFLRGERSPITLIVATSLPAAASLLLLIVALIVPGVYAVGKMAFPLNLTLPMIHCSIVYMLAQLTRGSFGLERPPEQLDGALLWSNLGFIGLCLVFQILLLSLLTAIRPSTPPTDATAQAQR